MSDAGYDIADYRDIDPIFGTLADADALIAEAHALGIRIIIDVVPNHGSDRHPVVRRGAGGRTRVARAGPVLVPAGPRRRPATCRRTTGSRSSAGPPGPGSPSPTARPASGTCTCSRPSSRTSTGPTPRSGEEFEDVLRFWFDRGADGIRIDSAALLTKDPELPDVRPGAAAGARPPVHRPRRCARHLPVLAGRRRRVPRPGADRRGLAPRRGAAGQATSTPASCTRCSTSLT